VAQFECGASAVRLRGSVIVPVSTNRMLQSQSWSFTAARGVQKPARLEGGAQTVLEMSIGGGAYAQAGLTMDSTQTSEEAVEINTVT